MSEFVVCLGYKGYVIREWFGNDHLRTADVSFDLVQRRGVGVLGVQPAANVAAAALARASRPRSRSSVPQSPPGCVPPEWRPT